MKFLTWEDPTRKEFLVGDNVYWNLRVRPSLPTDTMEYRRTLQKRFDELALSWHHGVVLTVADAGELDGPYIEVEYTHSTPAISYPKGTKLRLHNLTKITHA